MSRWFAVAVGMGLAVVGCGVDDGGDRPLVRVGSETIGTLALREYRAGLPESMQPKSTGEAAVRDLLRSMVGARVLLLEARALGLEQDSLVQDRVRRAIVRELIARVTSAEISPRVHVSEEEMRERFHADHWDQVHRPAHILSATEQDAREVLRLLRRGADFATLARERSLSKNDARHGGDLGRYFGPADVVTGLGEAVLGLQAGQIAGPVRTVDGWEVVKILDVREVPFEAVQGRLARALANKKRREVRAEVIAELERKHGVVYLSEGIRALLRPEQRAGAADVPLVRHAGGVIAVGAPGVAAALVGVPREFVADSTTLVAVLRDRLMGDSLLVFEARSRGLDQSPEIVALRQEVLKRTMLSELRRREVLEDVAVTPEEIRAAYEANRESYRLGAAVVIREILVHDQATANDLRARILAGENMADLAWAHSERPGAQASQGRFTVYPDAEGDWGGLREHLRQAPVGELVGPVPADGGYSLFRVEERQAERVRSLEEVEHAVRHRLRGEKADKAFAAYTRDLMQKYAAQITWNDENIRRVAATF